MVVEDVKEVSSRFHVEEGDKECLGVWGVKRTGRRRGACGVNVGRACQVVERLRAPRDHEVDIEGAS